MTDLRLRRKVEAQASLGLIIFTAIIALACLRFRLWDLTVAHLTALVLAALVLCRWSRKITLTLLGTLAFGIAILIGISHKSLNERSASWNSASDLLQRRRTTGGAPTFDFPPEKFEEFPTYSPIYATTSPDERPLPTSREVNEPRRDILGAQAPQLVGPMDRSVDLDTARVFDIEKLPHKSWSKSLVARIVSKFDFLRPPPPPPEPLWDRQSENSQINGFFRYVKTASQGYPDIVMIASSKHPERDLMTLARHLPDQQRRQRIAAIVDIFSQSPLLSEQASPETTSGAGHLADKWSASTLLGALMGVSNEEFYNLCSMVRRSKLIDQLSEAELRLLLEITQSIAEIAASQPVRRNTTYEAIISGRPLTEAPNNLAKMLNFLGASFSSPVEGVVAQGGARNLSDIDDRVESALLQIENFIDESYLPLIKSSQRRIFRIRLTITFSLIVMILWLLLCILALSASWPSRCG